MVEPAEREDELDLVVEGVARRVTDEDRLRRVAAGDADKTAWPVTVDDGAFDAPYGAPTAGPPPYHVFEIVPTAVFAFQTNQRYASTRWRFGSGSAPSR